MSKVSKFELVAVRPVKGKRGEVVVYRTVYADTVTAAVAQVRREMEGSGCGVLQAASYHRDHPANDVITRSLVEAYDKKFG